MSLQKQLNDLLMNISRNDLNTVIVLAFEYGLYTLSGEDIGNRLRSYAEDGVVDEDAFLQLFKDASPNGDNPLPAKIKTFFQHFDRNDSKYCDVDDLTVGLSLFTAGNKSAKLMFAFNLLDDDNDGFLSRRGTWRFIRAFLSGLVAMSSSLGNLTPEQINSVLDDASVQVTSEILETSKASGSQRVSFASIANWYANEGYKNSTWLELLDLKKWVSVPEVQAAAEEDAFPEDTEEEVEDSEYDNYDEEEEDDNDNEGEEEEEEDEEEEEEDDEVNYIKVSSSYSLGISKADASYILGLATKSSFSEMDASDLIISMKTRTQVDSAGRYVISHQDFLHFLYDLLPWRKDRTEIVSALYAIFCFFEHAALQDRERDPNAISNGVDFRKIASAFTMLCRGSKSAKLGVSFSLWGNQGSNDSGSLDKKGLEAMLSSYLLFMNAIGVMDDSNIVTDVSSALSDVICNALQSQSVTFVNFGEWYNAEGFHYAPWIELLNLEKWIRITGYTGLVSEDDNGAAADEEKIDEENDDEMEEEVAENSPLDSPSMSTNENSFSIVLKSLNFERKIQVSGTCAIDVHLYTSNYMHSNASFFNVVQSIENRALEGLITKDALMSILKDNDLEGALRLHRSEEGREAFMSKLFDAYDRCGSGQVDITELVIGLCTLLHSGSKSEKLAFAYDFIDNSKKGKIGRRNLWRFFRSFLIAIVMISCPTVEAGDFLQILADESAIWITDSITSFLNEDLGGANGENSQFETRTSFDDIADWYSYTGSSQCSWIELLNLEKWIRMIQP